MDVNINGTDMGISMYIFLRVWLLLPLFFHLTWGNETLLQISSIMMFCQGKWHQESMGCTLWEHPIQILQPLYFCQIFSHRKGKRNRRNKYSNNNYIMEIYLQIFLLMCIQKTAYSLINVWKHSEGMLICSAVRKQWAFHLMLTFQRHFPKY